MIIKKKILALLLAAVAICPTAYAGSVTHVEWQNNEPVDMTITPGSGQCGDSMYWNLDSDGTLTISGSGKMYEYVDYEQKTISIPWFEMNDPAVVNNIIVKDGVESISDSAFSRTSITSIILPDSVTEIGSSLFGSCRKLQKVVLPDNIQTLKEGTFAVNDNLTAIKMPANLKTIEVNTFIHCYKLKNISIPSGVTEMGENVFFDCTLLEEIVIPKGITELKYGVFASCDNLRKVYLPEGIKKIGDDVFSNCANLEQVILPDGLTEIGDGAFLYQDDLRSSDLPTMKIYIPKSVKTMGKKAIDDSAVIYGFKNSEAEKYAKENKIEFVEVSKSMYDAEEYEDVSTEVMQPDLLDYKTLSVYSKNGVQIKVDGQSVEFTDAQPFIDDNGRTQVPIYAVSSVLDCHLDWEVVWNVSSTAVIKTPNGDVIRITTGSDIMTVNDKEIQMDTNAAIIEDRTYLPIRFLAEAMGLEVEWINN